MTHIDLNDIVISLVIIAPDARQDEIACEYLARIHFRTMNRPPYAVREQIGATDANRALREPTGPLNLTTPGNRSADGAPRARSAKTG